MLSYKNNYFIGVITWLPRKKQNLKMKYIYILNTYQHIFDNEGLHLHRIILSEMIMISKIIKTNNKKKIQVR